MTGLDPDKNKILEVACIITDPNLKTVSEELEMIIHQLDEELNFMDSWNTHHHGNVWNLIFCNIFTLQTRIQLRNS